MTDAELNYMAELERLWDMVSDMIEGHRLTRADIPDDYWALTVLLDRLGRRWERADAEK